MTNEEITKIEKELERKNQDYKMAKLGLVVDKSNFSFKYEEARGNGTLNSVLDELKEIKENKSVDVDAFVNFASGFLNSVSNIKSTFESDTYSNMRVGGKEFSEGLSNLVSELQPVKEYLRVSERVEEFRTNLSETEKALDLAKRKVAAAKMNRTLENVEISEFDNTYYNDALDEKEVVEKNYGLVKQQYEDEVRRLEPLKEELKKIDVVKVTSELFEKMKNVDALYRNLEVTDELKDSLFKDIQDTRDKIVIYKVSMAKKPMKFMELYKSVGLKESNPSKEAERIETINKLEKEIKALESKLAKTNVRETEEVREEEVVKEQVSITKPQELVNEIKKLNPSTKVLESLDGEKTITVEDPSELKLPEGFKYDENLGINNKVDDLTPYINVKVETLNKTKDMEASEVKEETPVVEESNSRVPSGKCKVTRVRRAVLAPYVKSALCFGALGGVLLGSTMIGLTPIVYGMIGGASIGAIGQGIYASMVKDGYAKIDDVKAYETDSNYELPTVASNMVESVKGFGRSIVDKAKAMLNGYQENKNKKTEEVRAPEVEESLELPPHVEEKTELEEAFDNSFADSIANGLNEIDDKHMDMDMLDQIANGENYELEESRGGR